MNQLQPQAYILQSRVLGGTFWTVMAVFSAPLGPKCDGEGGGWGNSPASNTHKKPITDWGVGATG